MPYQGEVIHSGPQNITRGEILLNGNMEDPLHEKFAQYTPDYIFDRCAKLKIESTTEILIMHGLECTSSEVVNSVFNDLANTIDPEVGLKKFTLKEFSDKNNLQEWPLSQLALKCHHLQYLYIGNMSQASRNNQSQIMEFAGLAATNSACLETLAIECSGTLAEDG